MRAEVRILYNKVFNSVFVIGVVDSTFETVS